MYNYIMDNETFKLIKTVLGLVKTIDKKNISGDDKKNDLYENLKQIMGENNFNEKIEIINYILETIIYISNTHALSGVNYDNNWESVPHPADYMNYSSLYVMAKSDCCPERNMIVYLVDKADLYLILRDENKKPSFEWGETVGIMAGDKFTIYTGGEFQVTSVDLTYYRKPTPVEFQNCIDVSTGLPANNDVPCEFKDDIAEILVDNAVAILAADIESFNQYTRASNSVQSNT